MGKITPPKVKTHYMAVVIKTDGRDRGMDTPINETELRSQKQTQGNIPN